MKKIILIGIIAIILFSNMLVFAQEIDRVYVINLNYKKQANAEFLNLINSYVTQGYPVNYGEPTKGYRIDILSDANKTLYSIKFSVPVGAVSLSGLTKDKVKGTPDNLNFTIYVPYLKNAKGMHVYDKYNNKVLEIPAQQFFNLGESKSFEGELRVIYGDNTGYVFFLNTGTNLYELKSSEALPVSWSGSNVAAEGRVLENKLIIESISLKSLENASNQPLKYDKLLLNWISITIYGALILVIVAIFLLYRVIRRGSTNNLRLYVLDNLKKGFSKEQIRKALVKADYANKEIEQAFRGIK